MVAGRSVNESPRAPFAHLRACTKSSNAIECCSDMTCASLPPVPLLNIPASSLALVSSDKTFVGNKAEKRGPVLPLRVVEGVFSYQSQGLQGSPHSSVLVPPQCEADDEASCHDFHLDQSQELPVPPNCEEDDDVSCHDFLLNQPQELPINGNRVHMPPSAPNQRDNTHMPL